jgi:hypothetical protein
MQLDVDKSVVPPFQSAKLGKKSGLSASQEKKCCFWLLSSWYSHPNSTSRLGRLRRTG